MKSVRESHRVVGTVTTRRTAATRSASQHTAPTATASPSRSTPIASHAASLTAPLRGQWASQAGAPQLHGSRAAAWIAMWDAGSVVRRVSLLETLKRLHAESNSNALEEDFGDAAPLLFARITSWWKLRYAAWVAEASSTRRGAAAAAAATGDAATATPSASPSTPSSELLAQVEAITIFVRGSRYLLQFVEGGGAAALCDCLDAVSTVAFASAGQPSTAKMAAGACAADSCPRERRALTLLLLHIANSGRVYREMVGDVENLLHLLHALQRERDATVAIPVTELLAVLGKGHPRLAGSVQTGLLRVLACALPRSDDDGPTSKPAVASSPSASSAAASHVTSEVVVLSVARAVRALQLVVEQQHYAQFPTSGDPSTLTSAGRLIDFVPIVGLDAAITSSTFAVGGSGDGASSLLPSPDPLLTPFTTTDYLDALFRLALDEQHTAYRVEGNELLNLAAKNTHLAPRILTRCLDVVDDDVYTLEGDEAEDASTASQRLLRQRRQLSCGRAAVLILISRPMTAERRDLLLHLVAQRGGHFTLLKYLRLTQHGDSAAVVDSCHALQCIARASMELQRRRLGQQAANSARATASEAALVRMTEGIQAALGDAILQLLLFQELSEDDCMAILRSARAAVVGRAE